ncbi:glycosyltransferase family 4 protein [Rhodohalobacter sp. 8-1]|uniref:glycosyltransferase family 4 protein n=1 Tax=Rhodohalobacter sp. 8-1 TaxID=3131972 RepID=UPI0030ED03E2
MKVLIFVQKFGSITTTFIYNEILELSRHHNVLVVCCERGDEEKYPFSNVITVPLRNNRIIKKVKWLLYKYDIKALHYNLIFKRKINNLVAEFKPDLIHGHFGNESMVFFKNLEKKFLEIPTVVSFHGYDASSELKESSVYIRELRHFFNGKYPRKAIFCSEYLRNNLKNAGVQITDNNSDILFYGINTNQFSRKRYHEKSVYRFLQISSFREKKGHLYTVKAFAKFLEKNNRKNVELVLAGGGPLLKEIKEFTKKLNITDKVHFPGWVNHEEAQEWLESADCFLHHSVTAKNGDTEGMPNAIIEAMAMELPVISTVHAGIPEIIEHRVHGLLTKEKDVDTYSIYMEEIMAWYYLKRNRTKIVEQFSIPAHYNKLNDIYQDIASNCDRIQENSENF